MEMSYIMYLLNKKILSLIAFEKHISAILDFINYNAQMKQQLLILLLASLASCNGFSDQSARKAEPLSTVEASTESVGAKDSSQTFSFLDIVSDDKNYIRSMHRLHATCGMYKYIPNPNINVTPNVGGLTGLFDATGWHLDLNEDRYWDVHCYNNTPNDYIVIRCKPYTKYWETVNSFRVPANSGDVKIESFKPDNEDQWWVATVVKADGKQEICNGEPGGSDALLAPDSKNALFTWHQPSNFSIRVQAQ